MLGKLPQRRPLSVEGIRILLGCNDWPVSIRMDHGRFTRFNLRVYQKFGACDVTSLKDTKWIVLKTRFRHFSGLLWHSKVILLLVKVLVAQNLLETDLEPALRALYSIPEPEPEVLGLIRNLSHSFKLNWSRIVHRNTGKVLKRV